MTSQLDRTSAAVQLERVGRTSTPTRSCYCGKRAYYLVTKLTHEVLPANVMPAEYCLEHAKVMAQLDTPSINSAVCIEVRNGMKLYRWEDGVEEWRSPLAGLIGVGR